MLEGARPQELKQAEAAYDQAYANSENAKKDLERAEHLYKEGVIPAQQLDKAQTLSANAGAALKIAEENLSLAEEGARSQEVEIARQQLIQAEASVQAAEGTKSLVEIKKQQLDIAEKQVEEARIALELAQAAALQNDIKEQQIVVAQAQFQQATSNVQLAQESKKMIEIKKQDVEIAKAQVEQVEATLELATTQLENSKVSSPLTGTVTLEVAEEGELVPAGSTILKLVDIHDIWISVYIPEDRYGKIKRGDKAEVRVDSWSGEVFEGEVSYIASKAQFTPKSIQTKQDRVTLTYEVKIIVNNDEEKLTPGMPADVVILSKEEN